MPRAATRAAGATVYGTSRNAAKLEQAVQLIEIGALTKDIADMFEMCVIARLNILISGGTGAGKTTLLNILSGYIPETERIVTIEDAAELQKSTDRTLNANRARLRATYCH